MKAASPATAMTCSLPPARSRATAIPRAAERAVPACPAPKAVVLALGAQHEAVEAARLANGLHAVQAAGEHLVDVGLMADVEEQLVFGGVEDGVKGQGKLDDARG